MIRVKSITVEAKTTEEASRVEWLVRLVYWIPLVIVWVALSIIGGILWIINVFSIIIAARRVGMGLMKKVWQYHTKMSAYYWFLTDERPPILPE